MEQQKIDLFLATKSEYFNPIHLQEIRGMLESVDDSKSMFLFNDELRNPTIMLVIALCLGWDRFFLDDIGLGLLKVLTCYGCGIWWLVDVISIKKRTQEYNYKKLMTTLQFMR